MNSNWHTDYKYGAKAGHDSLQRSVDNDEIVDIEGIDSSVESQFNDDQANDLMTECERHMKTVRPAVTFHADEPIDR